MDWLGELSADRNGGRGRTVRLPQGNLRPDSPLELGELR